MKLEGYVQKYFSDRGFGFIAENKNLQFFPHHILFVYPSRGPACDVNVGVGKKGPAAVEVALVESGVVAGGAK